MGQVCGQVCAIAAANPITCACIGIAAVVVTAVVIIYYNGRGKNPENVKTRGENPENVQARE